MTVAPPRKRRVYQDRVLLSQLEQIHYDKKWGAARGGQRAGKSHGFARWLLVKRVQPYPRAVHCVVGANYEQLRRGFFPLLIGLLEAWGWQEGRDFKYRAMPSPMIFFLRWGKHVKLHSLSTALVERIRGTSIQTLLYEEPQTWGSGEVSGEDLHAILNGRLSHSQTTAELYPDMQTQGRMSFNPPAEGTWLWRLIEEQWKTEGYKCWKMSVRDNTMMLDRDDYVRGMIANLNPKRVPSEIDGEWSTGGGNVYYGFDTDAHYRHIPAGLPPVDFWDPDNPIHWSHDFNVRLMCSVIGQPWRQERKLLPGVRSLKLDQPIDAQMTPLIPGVQENVIRILDELALENSASEYVIEAFLKSKWADRARDYTARTGKAGVIVFGDPAGNQRSQQIGGRGRNTNWKIIMGGLKDAGIKAEGRMTRDHPRIDDSVNMANAQFRSGVGIGVTVNVPQVPVLVGDFRQVSWLPNGRDINKKNELLTHASDAYRYWAHRLRTSNFVFDERSALWSPDVVID